MSEREPAAPGGPAVPQPAAKPSWAALTTSPSGTAPSGWADLAPATAFTASRFIAGTLRTWARNVPRFVGVTVVGAIPVAIVAYLAHRSAQPPTFDRAHPFANLFEGWGRAGLSIGASLLLSPIVSGAVIFGTVQHLRGLPCTLGDMLSRASRRYLPFLVASVLATLTFYATLCTLAVPLVLGAGWCAAPGATLLEDRGPVAALGRSWVLSRGLRWRVVGGFLVVFAATMAVQFPIYFLARSAFAAQAALSFGERTALTQVVAMLVGAVPSSWMSVALGVAYHQLVEAAEGPAAAQLGRVFE